MSLENLEQDLAAYRAVLDDIYAGKLTLQQGQEEFLADLRQRIAALEARIARPASLADGSSADGSSGDGSFDGEPRFAG